jgi:PAS domain S-box-containing protein
MPSIKQILFLFVLLGFFAKVFAQQANLPVKDGIITVKGKDFEQHKIVKLEGPWAFYWSKLYTPNDFREKVPKPNAYISVPGVWTGTNLQGKAIDNTGYATYRLEIKSDTNASMVILLKEITSAYKAWFNGKLIAQVGKVSQNADSAVPGIHINKEIIYLDSGKNELVVQVCNYHHRMNAFPYAPSIGEIHDIDKTVLNANAVDLVVFGLLLIMAFYHFGLFIFRPKNLPVLTFSIFCFVAILRVLVTDNLLLGYFIPSVKWEVVFFLNYFTFYSLVPLLALLVQQAFSEKRFKWMFYSLYIISLLGLCTLFLPSIVYTELMTVFEYIFIFYFIVVLGSLLVTYAMKKREGAFILLLSILILTLTGVNDMLFFSNVIHTMELVPVGIFILILGQALSLGKKFSAVYDRNEELSISLDYKNKNLLKLIGERTQELEDEKNKLNESNKTLLKYYTAIEQNYAVILITNAAGAIEYANPQFEKTTGYSIQEALGKSTQILKSGKTPEETYPILWNTIQKGKVWQGEFINKKKTGEEYIEKATISPILNADGEISNYIAIKEDITILKNAERALRESEEKYRLIAENTNDVIWKVDLTTLRFNYISPSVYAMRGYSAEEYENRTVEGSLTPESYHRAMKDIDYYLQQATIEPDLSIRERYQQPCKDGRIIDIELSASFIRNKNGIPVEILGVTRDITSRVKIEQALKDSENKLARLLEKQAIKNLKLANQLNYIYNNTSSAIAFFKIDGDNIEFSSCNKLWANSLGFAPEEMEGFNIVNLNDDETEALYRKFISQAKQEKGMVQEYCRWHDMDLYVNIIPIKDEQNNEVISCACFVYNVTEKFQSELKMRESEAKFFNIFNNSIDGIALLTADLEIVEVNERLQLLFGVNSQETKIALEPESLGRFIPEKYLADLFEQVEKLRLGQSIPAFECEIRHFNGNLIPVELRSSSFMLSNSPMLLCMVRDISSRKNLEHTLAQVGIQIENRERRKLATDLHDNVGPLLSSMNMYLSALARKPDLLIHQEAFSDIRRILKDAITSVREISNNISPQVLNSYGLTSALELFFETKRKLIDINLDNNLEDFRFSELKEIMLYTILKEAFNNSLKYSNATQIDVKLVKENNLIFVVYKDNGIGFNLDEKLDTANTSLGLFSIINRVKNLEGSYKIKTSPGNGFALELVFPIDESIYDQN